MGKIADEIKMRREAIREHEEAIRELKRNCHHVIPEQEPDEYGGYWGAECAGCGERFGWYCPSSPDHACHYYTEEDEDDPRPHVLSINGEKIYLTEKQIAQVEDWGESDDYCIFCGHPEERK